MTNPSFLLDSNICVYVLGDAAGAAALRLGSCKPGEVVTSAIAYAEVVRGTVDATVRERIKLGRLFEVVPVLAFDAAAAAVLRVFH